MSERLDRYHADLQTVREHFDADEPQAVFSCQLLLSVRDFLLSRPPSDTRLETMTVADIIALVKAKSTA